MENEKILEIYKNILYDVLQNRNLETHRKDVDAAIEEVEEKISVAKSRNEKYDGFEKVKNELYFLKWQIAERT